MTTYRVECHTPDDFDADRRIQGLGGTVPSPWWFGIDTIINMINGGHIFYVMVGGNVVLVVVRQHATSKRWYLTTLADSFPPNNLLNLSQCRG